MDAHGCCSLENHVAEDSINLMMEGTHIVRRLVDILGAFRTLDPHRCTDFH